MAIIKPEQLGSGSYSISGSFSGSFQGAHLGTSSYATNALSSSYADTASYAPLYLPLTGGTIDGNVTINGTASISFLNVQYESASVIYSSGSNQFGDATNDTQTLIGTVLVSGSQQITGSLNVTSGITGSLFGTSSYALTSSYSTNILGVNNYVPKFIGVNSIGTSSIYNGLYNNIGIGTTTPRNTLDVAGPIYANEVWTIYGFFLGDMDAGASYTYLSGDGVSSTNSYLTLATNATDRMRITHAGNVGIGTSTPLARLDVRAQGALSTDIAFKVRNSANTTDLMSVQGDGVANFSDNIVLSNNKRIYASNSSAYYINIASGANTTDIAGFSGIKLFTGVGSEALRITSTNNVGIGTTSPTYKLDVSGSARITNGLSVTGSLIAPSITGSLLGTASYAVFAETASNILGGTATHIPYFITDTTLATSSIYQSGSTSIIINQDNNTTANPEALYVWQPHPTSINVVSGKGNLDNYLQLNIQNTNQGTAASSDIVATANNGSEADNYIDMGINSENFNGFLGGDNDSYLYAHSHNMWIGNINDGYDVNFFNSSSEEPIIKLTPAGQAEITGSLHGTASWARNAVTASNSITSSYALLAANSQNAISASYALNSSTSDTSTSASHAIIADSALAANYATNAGNGGVTSIIAGAGITLLPPGGTGNVTVISSGGGGVTIISGSNITQSFVNSDTWVFNHGLGIRTPTITVFDSNYNQIIPENIVLTNTASATITFPTLESGFAVGMVGGVAGNAYSASYALFSTYASTASVYNETDPVFVAKSGSFATTGSNSFKGNQTITGSLIVSSSNSLTVIGPITITGSLLVSGSTTQIGNNTLIGNTVLSGSINVSGSQTFIGNNILTGSFSVTGSTLQTGNNTLVGNTVLSGSINVSGSQTFKGNNILTGSFSVTGSTVQIGNNTLFGNTTLTGSITMTGSILIFGDILPQISSSYNLGSETQPWKSIYVQSGSISIQSDTPGNPPATISNQTGNISISSAGFQITSGSTNPFRIDTTGRTRLIVPFIPANDIGAFSIIGNTSGSYQPVINPSGMIHVTSNDAQAARITVDGFGTNIGAIYAGRHARGTAALPTPTLLGDTLVRFAGLGYATSSYFPVVGAVPTSLEFQATENYSTSSYGSRAVFYTYANGAISRSLSAIIDATGITIPSSSRFFGTASWAENAVTASYVTSSNIVGTVLSSSYALTASHALNVQIINTGSFATTGSNTFRGNQIVSGSLTLNSGSALNINDGFFVNGHKQFQYASFYHTASQTLTSATSPLPFQFSTIENNSGIFTVELSGSRRSRITTNTTGWWNIQYSAQVTNGSSFNNYDSYTWIRVNEVNAANSNNIRTIPQDAFDLLASRNTLIYLESGSYFEIMYGAASTQVSFPYTGTGTSPTRPATPSISLVVTQHA
jgi:hypothetical protein